MNYGTAFNPQARWPARDGQQLGFAFSEAANLPAKLAIPIPESMALPETTVFQASDATADHALVQRAKLLPGETK
jgi:NADPH2:quinone reductase